MKYYNKIKQKLINIEITKKAKDYCKNKNGLIAYYNVQKKFSNEKISTVLAQFRHNITEYIKKIKKIKSDILTDYSKYDIFTLIGTQETFEALSRFISGSDILEIL